MIEYKGKPLLNNILVTRYFKQISGKKFFEEFANLSNLIKKKGEKGKNKELALSYDEFDDFTDLFLNVYLAGRCAYERRLLSVEEQDNELADIPMADVEFYQIIYDFMDELVKTSQKSSNNVPKKN